MNVTVRQNGLVWADVLWSGVQADHYDLWLDGRFVQSVRSQAVTDQLSLHWPGRISVYTVVAMDAVGHEVDRAVAAPYVAPWPAPLAGEWPIYVITIDHPDVRLTYQGQPMSDEQIRSAFLDPAFGYEPGLVPFVQDCSFGALTLVPDFRRIALDKPSTAYDKTAAGQAALYADIVAKLNGWDLTPFRLGCLLTGGSYVAGAGGMLPGSTCRLCSVASVSALSHEVGHLLGLNHAGRLLAMPDDLLHWSGTNPYGDTFSPMGGWQAFAHHSALDKMLMGWLPQDRVIETATAGAYVLNAIDGPPVGVQALVIPLDGAGNAYVVERVTKINTNGGFAPCFLVRFRPAQAVLYTTSQLLTWRTSEPFDVMDKWQPHFDQDHPFLDKVRGLGLYVVDEQTVRLVSLSETPLPQAAPPMPTITAAPDPTTTEATATLAFEDAQVGVLFLADLDGTGFQPCSSPVTYPTLGLGGHVFSVKARDALGQESDVAMVAWTVVAPPPPPPLAVRITSPAAGSRIRGGSLVPLLAAVENAAGDWAGQTWLVSAGTVQGGLWATPRKRMGGPRQNGQTVAVKVWDGKGRTATASETVTIT